LHECAAIFGVAGEEEMWPLAPRDLGADDFEHLLHTHYRTYRKSMTCIETKRTSPTICLSLCLPASENAAESEEFTGQKKSVRIKTASVIRKPLRYTLLQISSVD